MNNIFKLLALFFSIILLADSMKAMATAQTPDKIIINKKEYHLLSNPLESYFKKFPEKRPRNGANSTGLWRGYIATFEIRDSILFLKDIEIEIMSSHNNKENDIELKSVMAEVFPLQNAVSLDWYTGLLVIPEGEIINYVHMGYASTYEKYQLLEIQQGKHKKTKKLSGEQYDTFRDLQFQEFQKTEDYRIKRLELKNDFDLEQTNRFLKEYEIEFTSIILKD